MCNRIAFPSLKSWKSFRFSDRVRVFFFFFSFCGRHSRSLLPVASFLPKVTFFLTSALQFSVTYNVKSRVVSPPAALARGGKKIAHHFGEISTKEVRLTYVFLRFSWWGCCCVGFWHCPLLFMALSTVFLSINSLDNSPLSHSVLPVLFQPYSLLVLLSYENHLQLWYNPLWLTGLKAPTN